jgi:hypothetical protein
MLSEKKSLNLLADAKITDLCIFCDILAISQAWNIYFALSSSLLLHCKFYCHTFLWIRSRIPSHVPYLALLPPDGTCVALVLPLLPFPSILPCLSLLVLVIDLDSEYRLNSHKTGLTFTRPYIVIYPYNKSQRDELFLKFILVKNSTCFGQIYCLSPVVLILYSQQLVFAMLVMLPVC